MHRTILVQGLDRIRMVLSSLPKEANDAIRDASREIAETEAIAIRQAGESLGGVARLAAKSVRARRDRTPVIVGGGPIYIQVAKRPVKLTKTGKIRKRRKATERATAGHVFFGAEFGGQRRKTTQQFQPHQGTTGYFWWPTIRKDADKIVAAYREKFYEVVALWGDR